MGELIAILSGKGGTGKTSLCAGIATALAQQGERVLCIDCDVGLRNLDIALGISDLGALSFTEICSGSYSIQQAMPHPVYNSLYFLTAPLNCTSDAVDIQAFGEMLYRAQSHFNYILLDAPAGIERGFTLAARFAGRVLLVTGPDPAAIRDARRAGEVLELMGKGNVRLIVNRVNKKTVAAMGMTVDDIMDQAGLPLLGIVPDDTNMVLAAAYRQPLLGYTRGGAAAACRRIAKRIRGIPTRIPMK
ncbi:MAG: P-loop NTPase [Oscillospiraceae bacterium]|nr:P-loop NTPase [Oscillospiraceae bacterium]